MNDEFLYETTVVGPRPPLSAGFSVVPREEISHALPGSGSELLSLVPGVRIVQHGAEGKGHQLFLRGFDAVHGSDVEVRLSGVSLNERVNVHGHGYVDLYGIIPEVVSEILVHKGPFLPWQGDFATAGTVSFELGVPAELRPGLVRTEASHRGRLRGVVVAAPHEAPPEAFFGGEAVYDAGFGPDREAVRGAFNASYGWRLGRGFAHRFHETYGPAGHGESDRVFALAVLEHDRDGTDIEVGIHGEARRLALEDNYTGYLLNEEHGDRRRQHQSGGTIGAMASLEQDLPIGVPTTLLGGLGWRFDAAEQEERQVLEDGSPWQTNRNLLAAVSGLHVYSGLRLRPWGWLEVLPSVRGDLLLYRVDDHLEDERAGKTIGVFSPRLATALSVHDAITLFADYGRGFRSPEPRSIAASSVETVEDEEVAQYAGGKPEVAVVDAVEAGAAILPTGWIELRAAWFGTWIEREVIFDHVSNLNLELDGTRRLGVEAAVRIDPLHWIGVYIDLTWVDARFRRSGHHVPGSSPLIGRTALHLGEHRGPHGDAELFFSADRTLAHGATASGYLLLDLSAGWRFDRFDVTLVVNNATDVRWMDGVYHYASWFDRDEPRSGIPAVHFSAGAPLTARLVFTAFF
jgi:outer membrane receptor protein involved in Fe transport